MAIPLTAMIITSSPCMPKSTYHCGNAISSIYAELIYRYQRMLYPEERFVVADTPWNIHGKPYANMFKERYGREGSYEEILDIAQEQVEAARREISFFMKPPADHVEHCDADMDFVEYTKEAFIRLIENGILVYKQSSWYIDTASFLADNDIYEVFRGIDCIPTCHKDSIIKKYKTFDGYFPGSKERAFAVSFEYKGEIIDINPIFQSFIYPNWLMKRFQHPVVNYLIGGSGFNLLTWQYYRQIISYALTGGPSIRHMLLHGTIMVEDGGHLKAMSKHSNNCVQPSQLNMLVHNLALYDLGGDINLVRYVLIRSLSDNNITLQRDKAIKEYRAIKDKLGLLATGMCRFQPGGEKHALNDVTRYLKQYKFNQALEAFFCYLRKTTCTAIAISDLSEQEITLYRRIRSIYDIFFYAEATETKGAEIYIETHQLSKLISSCNPDVFKLWSYSCQQELKMLIQQLKIDYLVQNKQSAFGLLFEAQMRDQRRCFLKFIPPQIHRYESEKAVYELFEKRNNLMAKLYRSDNVRHYLLIEYAGRRIIERYEQTNTSNGGSRYFDQYNIDKENIQAFFDQVNQHPIKASEVEDASQHFVSYESVLMAKRYCRDKMPAQVETYLHTAKKLYSRYFTASDMYVIHGDMHRDNLLCRGNRICAIDPIGYIAPLEIEYARFLGTELERSIDLDTHTPENSQTAMQQVWAQWFPVFARYSDRLLVGLYIDVLFRMHNTFSENSDEKLFMRWEYVINFLSAQIGNT